MAGTIDQFRASFSTDLARPSRFDVNIPIPVALGFNITTGRSLNMRCEAAQLPGRTIETTTKKLGSAPIEKFPIHTNYNEITLDFIVSDNMNEKIFFDAWMELINPTTDFNMQYKNNYAVDILINQYDVTNKLTYSANMIEAFPIDVNQMDLNWSSVDSVHKLSVVFAYKQWQNNTVSSLIQQIKNSALTGIVNNLTS
jgi:hypothetical protein